MEKKITRLICLPAFFLIVLIASCRKELSYEGPAKIPFAASWEFKQDTISYTGTFDSVLIRKQAGIYDLVFAEGNSSINLSEKIQLKITDTIIAGSTYKASDNTVQFTYFKNGFALYKSVPLNVATDFSLTITAVSDSSITGTFSGKVQDVALQIKDIKEGKFSAQIKAAGDTSLGSLQVTGDSCTGAILEGVYKKGVPMNASNTVSVSVKVTKPGAYTIKTDTLNGLSFNKAGIFTTKGIQVVTLHASGTPADSGLFRFKVQYGATSSCTFGVRVDTLSTVISLDDYFPMTQNSWWSYNTFVAGFPPIPDTAKITADGSAMVNGYNYKRFILAANGLIRADTFYYRKLGNTCIEYCSVDDYSVTFKFDNPVYGDLSFLRVNLPVGAGWDQIFTGKVGGNKTVLLYRSRIAETNGTANVNGHIYNNVIKVDYGIWKVNPDFTMYAKLEDGTLSFAKNIGLIQRKITPTGAPSTQLATLNIRYYHVN